MKSFCWVAVSLSVTVLHFPLFANPTGGTVAGGGAQITGQGTSTLTINQSGSRAIINWSSFSLNAGERTTFRFNGLASANSAVLNRVSSSGGRSTINGVLESFVGTGSQVGGTVFLLNPNGILVGPSGRINAGSFIGSTLDLGPDEASANRNFLAGRNLTFSGNSTAGIRLEGDATSQAEIRALGPVFLIAHSVENGGHISGSHVGLAAGARVELRQVNPSQPGAECISVLAGRSGTGTHTGVNNKNADPAAGAPAGVIQAAVTELKAAGGNIYALAINNGGAVRATHLVNEGGRIYLRSDGGKVTSSGLLDASDTTPGHKGGHVQVLGGQVNLEGQARVDVSGAAGGGTALIGGDYQGKNSHIPNSQQTFVSSDALITADALSSGDGGKVVVWSDHATRFAGTIEARGAGSTGTGGNVEVSGKYLLDYRGHVDASAPSGRFGNLLLDPTDLYIEAEGTSDLSRVDEAADPDLSKGYTVLSSYAIEYAQANVTLAARHDIIFHHSVANTGIDLTATAGNAIYVNESISVRNLNMSASTINVRNQLSASGSMTLSASQDINFSQPPAIGNGARAGVFTLSATDPLSLSAGGNIRLNASRDINFSRPVNTTASLLGTAGQSINLNQAITAGQLSLSGATLNLNQNINAGSGTVTLQNSSSAGGLGQISAGTLVLAGNGQAGSLSAPLNTTVGNLLLEKTGGNSFINETDGLNVGGATLGDLNLMANGNVILGINPATLSPQTQLQFQLGSQNLEFSARNLLIDTTLNISQMAALHVSGLDLSSHFGQIILIDPANTILSARFAAGLYEVFDSFGHRFFSGSWDNPDNLVDQDDPVRRLGVRTPRPKEVAQKTGVERSESGLLPRGRGRRAAEVYQDEREGKLALVQF